MKQHTYIAIDLKSFYASVECRERGLDPLDTNLVVADESRTDKTICLAVTPSLKSYGISGRGRLFEVKQRVKEANAGRQHDAPGHRLDGTSHFYSELQANPYLAIDFIIAPPRMAYYMEYSTRIYQVYLKYIAPEDIVVYSIDEVFMDVTDYLNTYKLSAHDLAMKIILDVLETTGITATAGIGTNLFLCKVAMDIVAKHIPADKNGVRIAELDEMKFRRELWAHQPLTDFWRVGRGIAKKLEQNGMFTMGDVALCSERNEDLLYKLFGKNAELLIDHAWGAVPGGARGPGGWTLPRHQGPHGAAGSIGGQVGHGCLGRISGDPHGKGPARHDGPAGGNGRGPALAPVVLHLQRGGVCPGGAGRACAGPAGKRGAGRLCHCLPGPGQCKILCRHSGPGRAG